jgi:hypothetical protein
MRGLCSRRGRITGRDGKWQRQPQTENSDEDRQVSPAVRHVEPPFTFERMHFACA